MVLVVSERHPYEAVNGGERGGALRRFLPRDRLPIRKFKHLVRVLEGHWFTVPYVFVSASVAEGAITRRLVIVGLASGPIPRLHRRTSGRQTCRPEYPREAGAVH
jgi:hypothetical protein